MKRILSLVLLMAMLMSLVACSDEPQTTEPQATIQPTQATTEATEPQVTAPQVDGFSVGYSKINVNPETQIPLVGFSNTKFRWAKEIIDNVYTTAVAMTDGQGNTIILINADIVTTNDNLRDAVKVTVSAATGIPQENIILCGTHSHSLPDYASTDIYESQRYNELLTQRIIQSAIEAWQDLKPAKLYVGSIETESMNFVRSYEMNDGTYVSDNHGKTAGKTYVGHVKDADPTLHVAKITREGGKDIVICNWRAHPHFTGGASIYNLSSDYVGTFRDSVESMTGADFLFLQGAAGNINEKSRISGENRTSDYRVYGAILGDYTVQCLENNMTEVTTDQICVQNRDFYGDIISIDVNLYYVAQSVNSVFTATGNATQAMALAGDSGIQSVYHASALTKNYNRTKERDGLMTFTAVSIGDVFAFVTFPGEAFDTISERVEEASPFDMTMFVGYCNGHVGYLPDEEAWSYGCYETDITRFVKGTDTQVVDIYTQMLNELAE